MMAASASCFLMGFLFGPAQSRQEQAGQDRDDGDHDQQFNQREA